MNSSDPKLQLKKTKSGFKNKCKDLYSELRGFKFVTALVLEFKKIESDEPQNIAPFICTQKQKKLLMKEILIIYLNQYIAQFNYLLVKYLHPANHHPPRIKKSGKKNFCKRT